MVLKDTKLNPLSCETFFQTTLLLYRFEFAYILCSSPQPLYHPR